MAKSFPRLIAITDAERFGMEETLRAFERLCFAARPGTVCVQVRETFEAAVHLEFARQLQSICSRSEQVLSINDRLDLALALRVGAVHLKGSSVAAEEVKTLWAAQGLSVWLTRAWHLGEVRPGEVVDAWMVSPVVDGRKGRSALGLSGLSAIVRDAAPSLVYALGGVEPPTVRPILGTGAHGVAAISACYVHPLPLVQELGIIR
jgi:thiamine-phosphate pyrophosphorylase